MRQDNAQRESFVAYRSFEKKRLPDTQRLKYYDALFAYALRQEVPDFKGDVLLECVWECVTPQIDANQRRYLNGLKGGAPAGNQNAKKQPRNNQKQPNVNDNVNVNDNDNDFKMKSTNLVYPYQSQEFINTWKLLRAQPKWKRKTLTALQKNLDKLGKYPEEYAIILMDQAIANGYQGVVFPNTSTSFEIWKKNNPGQTREGHTLRMEDLV